MKRIALVLEATVGGTREHILQILDFLDPTEWRRTYICSPRRSRRVFDDIASLREQGIEVVVIPMEREIRPWSDLRALIRLVTAFRRGRYDIVHTHSSKAGFLGRLAARLAGVPKVIHTGHVFAFQWSRGLVARFYLRLERVAARWADQLVAVSERQRDLLLRHHIAPAAKVVTIPNGVDLSRHPSPISRREARERLHLAPDVPVVGMVARLVPQKGCGHFLRAARRVLDEMPDVRFLLVGEGELEDQIRQRLTDLSMEDRFSLLGLRADTAEILRALDVFVLSSLWEGLPYVILEAMAAELPVVASRLPGLDEIVQDGETGYLTGLRDEAGIADRILTLLRDDDLRRRLGRQGRALVLRSYRAEDFRARLLALYRGREIGNA